MNDLEKVKQLETALLQQAESLAREQQQNAAATCARIKAEATERLQQREAREIQSAKQQSERLLKRMVQSEEARFAGELDRLRWTLVQSTLTELNDSLQKFAANRSEYAEWLKSVLNISAAQLPQGEVKARIGSEDYDYFFPQLEQMAQQALPNRKVTWEPLTRAAGGGGIEVSLADDSVRIDNTFAGRLQRLELELAQTIMERLFAASPDLGTFVHG